MTLKIPSNRKKILNQIFSPIPVSDFFEQYYENRWLHIQRNDENYFKDALTIEDLDFLLQQKILPQGILRIANAKTGKDDFNAPTFSGKSFIPLGEFLDNEQILSQFAQSGTSLVFQYAQEYLPRLGVFVSQLEKDMQCVINVNIYVTPPQSQAYMPHYDCHDSFILQIFGRKTWYMYDSYTEFPDKRQKNLPKSSVTDAKFSKEKCKHVFEIRPGDTLYVPRGWLHCAETTTSPSIHLTVGLHTKKKYDIIEGISDLAIDRVTFRRSMPHYGTHSDQIAFIEEFKKELIDFIQKVPSEEIFTYLSDDVLTNKTHHHKGHFQEILFKDKITGNSKFQMKSGTSFKINMEDNKLTFHFGRNRITYPVALKPVIDFISQGEEFSAKNLPINFSDQRKLQIVKLFVQDGFVTVVSY